MTAHLDEDEGLLISMERAGRTARIAIQGEVDVKAHEAITAAAARIHPAHDHVIIDLSGVTFIDSHGFEQVLLVRDVLTGTGCRVELVTTGMTDLMLQVVQSLAG